MVVGAVVVLGFGALLFTNRTFFQGFGGSKGDGEAVLCTQDAMQCPDGSYVGRVGADCAFALCPGATTSPNTLPEGFDFKG